MPTILALHGPQGAGKTTLAHRLASHLNATGRRAVVMSFAEPLKRLCWELFGVEYGSHQSQDFKNAPSAYPGWTPRHIWQHVGATMRQVWPDVWVERARHAAAQSQADVVIFDDLRYPNEADAVHDDGGAVVWLTDAPLGCGGHESDVAMQDWYGDFDDVFSGRALGYDAAIMRLVSLVNNVEVTL